MYCSEGAVLFPCSINYFLRKSRGNFFITRRRECEYGGALGYRAHGGREIGHFRHRHFAYYFLHFVFCRVHTYNAHAPFVYIAYNVAAHFIGHQNFQCADRLKQNGGSLRYTVLKGYCRRHFKGHFRGVYRVIRAVHQRCLYAHHWVARKHALCGAITQSLFNRGEEVFRYGTAEYLFFKHQLIGIAGLKLNPYITEQPVTTRLLFVPPLYLYRLTKSLAVGDFRLFKLNLRAEFGF